MRLDTVAKVLSSKLRAANSKQLRAASLAACQHALLATPVDAHIVLTSLIQMQQHGSLSTQQVAELNDLAAELDTQYFNLQEQAEIHPESQPAALLVFRQARAVSAVAFAGGDDTFTATMEAIYEASMAVDEKNCIFDAALGAMS